MLCFFSFTIILILCSFSLFMIGVAAQLSVGQFGSHPLILTILSSFFFPTFDCVGCPPDAVLFLILSFHVLCFFAYLMSQKSIKNSSYLFVRLIYFSMSATFRLGRLSSFRNCFLNIWYLILLNFGHLAMKW